MAQSDPTPVGELLLRDDRPVSRSLLPALVEPPTLFCRERARLLLRSALAAYLPGDDGFHLTDPHLGHLGSVFETPTEMVVAYRGSIVPRKSHTRGELKASLNDWLAVNFNVAQVPALGGRVHRGWLERLDRSWADVWRRVAGRLNGRPLWITGHSMGGAVSILAGRRFAECGVEPAGVYAFGAPKVGDSIFAARYPAPLFCVENRHDLVPWLPLPKWMIGLVTGGHPLRGAVAALLTSNDYRKAGEEWWITPGGDLRRPTWKDRTAYRTAALLAHPHRFVSDHWIEEYTAFLDGDRQLPAERAVPAG